MQKVNRDSSQQKLLSNIKFIGDSLLKGAGSVVKNYFARYQPDTCGLITYDNNRLKDKIEPPKWIEDVNGDHKKDRVFVLPPFHYCDDGDSYVFYDTSLPRLYTDSYCCHPDNLFSIGDIDEDGFDEICIFYSSCVSRFKSLIAYTLKAGKWKQIGRCTFDIAYMLPVKEKRVRKTGRGKFKMLEVNQNGSDQGPNGVQQWQAFSF